MTFKAGITEPGEWRALALDEIDAALGIEEATAVLFPAAVVVAIVGDDGLMACAYSAPWPEHEFHVEIATWHARKSARNALMNQRAIRAGQAMERRRPAAEGARV
jgi:hypothetical protein